MHTGIDGASLLERADLRWSEILRERPDLAPALTLQRALVSTIIEIADALDADDPPLLSIPPAVLQQKMIDGVPAFRGEHIEMPPVLAGSALLDLCTHLETGGAGSAARHIHDALDRRRISPASLLSASLARDQRAVRMGAEQMGLSPDLLWLVGELAVGPFASRLQQAIFQNPADSSDLTSPLMHWDQGYCPACGSWPALAEVCQGERQLRCSFCGSGWSPATYRCTYCSETGDAHVAVTPDLTRPGRSLELCGTCGGYLKVVEVVTHTPFALLPIEDLAATDLDVLAMERGYGRPPLPDQPAAAPPCDDLSQ